MCNVTVKLILLISISLLAKSHGKSVKRNQKDTTVPNQNDLLSNEATTRSPKGKARSLTPSAILAIEIVDSGENSTTKSKNSKRTVNSQLSYGFQPNYYGVSDKPKLVFYKYSQRNIPPYQGGAFYGGKPDVNVQKSVEYDLANQPQAQYNAPIGQEQNLEQYYQPGTTLFTTLNQQGHLNQLSPQVPQHGNLPVIYLKISNDQLTNPGLYPNLPESHPYSNLNGVNLQSLLAGYLQNTNDQNIQQVYHTQPDSNQQLYQDVTQNYQQVYVIPSTDQKEDYYLNQQIGYHQNYQDQINQLQYQQYIQPQQVQQVYQQHSDADDLPTHENYPDDAHTRVIFHSDNGGHFPEKPQSLKSNVVPSVSSYKSKDGIPPPRSYSSLEFKPSQPDYTIKQQQDTQGYYYYKPTQSTSHYEPQYQIQSKLAQVNAQGEQTPFNYHAHPRSYKKRNARRPGSITTEKSVKAKL